MWFKRKAAPQPDYLVFGLGNPGVNYAGTRHNIGWWVLDELARRTGVTGTYHKHHGQVDQVKLAGKTCLLIKPTTLMNRSGRCIMAWLRANPDAQWVVVLDDITMAPGKLRLRTEGNAGGHNGAKSIISGLGGNQFDRLKLGVGKPGPDEDAADYVLAKPTTIEEDALYAAVTRAADVLTALIEHDWQAALDVIAKLGQQA